MNALLLNEMDVETPESPKERKVRSDKGTKRVYKKKPYNPKEDPETSAIVARMFQAIRKLIEMKKLKSFYAFTSKYGINPGNFHYIEKHADTAALPVLYLHLLVKDYKVSAHWLLTGLGEMIMP